MSAVTLSFVHDALPMRVVFGPGRLAELGEEVERLGLRRVLVLGTPEQAATMLALLRKVRDHVEKNFDNVGERFPEEVRRMHHGEAEERNVFGQASLEEAKQLIEEGIQVQPLPDLPKLDG